MGQRLGGGLVGPRWGRRKWGNPSDWGLEEILRGAQRDGGLTGHSLDLFGIAVGFLVVCSHRVRDRAENGGLQWGLAAARSGATGKGGGATAATALLLGDDARAAPGRARAGGRGVFPTCARRDRARGLRLGFRRKRRLGGAALALRREVCHRRRLVRGRG